MSKANSRATGRTTKQLNVRLTAEQERDLDAAVAKSGLSRSEFVAEIARAFVEFKLSWVLRRVGG